MNQSTTFSELDVDPIEGANIMRMAGINPDDLRDPHVHSKVLDIMQFFKGKSDTNFMISKLLTGKPGINPVDHLWGYATLRNQYETVLKSVEQLKEQLNHYE